MRREGVGCSPVIQYEFAGNAVDHLHRLGRTARAGTTGIAPAPPSPARPPTAPRPVPRLRGGGGGATAGAAPGGRLLVLPHIKGRSPKMTQSSPLSMESVPGVWLSGRVPRFLPLPPLGKTEQLSFGSVAEKVSEGPW